VAENFVIDASPLIFLTKANELNLLQQVVKKEVLVPDRVEMEIQISPHKCLHKPIG
jgi:predicted nucleic acid-binding protein